MVSIGTVTSPISRKTVSKGLENSLGNPQKKVPFGWFSGAGVSYLEVDMNAGDIFGR